MGQSLGTLSFNEAEYATSPPVYPAPASLGTNWEAAFAQASNFVSQLTTDEKAFLVTGIPGPCVGSTKTISRLAFDGLCLQDGPVGIRQGDYASVFPAGLTVAASWDRALAGIRGQQIGAEFVGKGANVALGPVAGPLGRSPYSGRTWEGFSPDPYLTGDLFGATIQAMESSGAQACAKHFIGNEQETQRNPTGNIEAVSSNIDDRTMHELYLWPFANGVKAGVSSVMCSYNRINGSYGCQNSKLLNGLLKDELGFQGYVVSDWGATHAGIAGIEAGLDMDMPGSLSSGDYSQASLFGGNITTAVNNGSLSMDRLDDMCRRVMTPYFRLQQNSPSFPKIDPSCKALNTETNLLAPPSNETWPYNNQSGIDVRGDHAGLIRELGAAGIVLLKNTNNTLPLKKPKNIAVFGNDAGDLTESLYSLLIETVFPKPFGYEFGVLGVGGGSGTGRFSDIVPPLEALKTRTRQDGTLLQYVQDNTPVISAGALSKLILTTGSAPDVCIVFLKTWAAEATDRTTLDVDWDGNTLVNTVTTFCNSTIVVTHSAGLNVLPFASNPKVTAILAAHLGGEQVGNAIVDVLYGDVNPSGHLPYTIPYNESDYSFAAITNSSDLLKTTNATAWQSDFTERTLIDYRHFDYYNISVAYPFGFGLSYTTFDVTGLTISTVANGTIAATPEANVTAPGGNPALWGVLHSVTVTVQNTGSVAGAAVPQLYLSLPGPGGPDDVEPKRVLRGYEKVGLQSGEAKQVTFDLMRRDLSYWDVVSQQWVIADADVGVQVGFDSRDAALTGSFCPLS